ncbi:hypothetical protein DHBDCA_p1367 [Dehalobacter sp. DCA]|jgi:hypothetical protein|uniref:hypothetical protein n=1 Tax=Dehalobacter sp. DCA TaxID=1147129 RepID=UPI00028BBA60|nr:hypothetical protein [Dehalobacter sp. DCA]AFV02396.1 hypothetical protein DHBDCA_p1367 [Dehalobacter sp. DCA]
MSRLEEFKESKQYILEDTLGSITPANSREADIYSFMRSYLDDELGGEDKAELLEELAKCITGKPYDRPKGREQFYSQKEVDELAAIMDSFIDGLLDGCAEGHLPQANALREKAWSEITALDEKTGGHLMDSWRRDEIHRWMEDACDAFIHEAIEIKNSMGGMQML